MAGIGNNVLFGANVDFSGSTTVSGEINLNGELLVGASVAPFIRPYVPTGSNGLVVNTGLGTIDFSLANIPNGALANSTINVIAGTGLTGGGNVSLGGSVTLNASSTITVTQYDVLVGGAANAIVSVGPGSAGQILQSGGNAANPAYSTPTYPSASGTARTILVADGTNNIYSTETYATPGTSGNVMTSDGTNWTSSAPPAGSNNSTNAAVNYSDDFLYSNESVGLYGIWTANNVGNSGSINFNNHSAGTIVAAHPGIASLSTSGNATGYAQLSTLPGGSESCIILGAGALTITFYFNINNLSAAGDRYQLQMGLGDTNNAALQANGCYVIYEDNVNSGKWQYVTAAASTLTTTNSSTVVATGWQVVQIVVNAAASSVSFSAGTTLANLASLGTANTTHIPTLAVAPMIGIYNVSGTTTRTIDVDLITINIALTTAR